MNYNPNQNGKVLEERLAGFNSGDVKTTLRRLRCFKMILPLLQVLQKSHPIPVTLLHITESRWSTEGPCDLQVKLVIIQS